MEEDQKSLEVFSKRQVFPESFGLPWGRVEAGHEAGRPLKASGKVGWEEAVRFWIDSKSGA